MRNFAETTVAGTCHHHTASLVSKIKRLTLRIMLLVISAALPISAFAFNITGVNNVRQTARINNVNRAAVLEKQRALNKANLSRSRHFDKKSKSNSLKLDALPPSPRHGAYRASTDPVQSGSAKTHVKTTERAIR